MARQPRIRRNKARRTKTAAIPWADAFRHALAASCFKMLLGILLTLVAAALSSAFSLDLPRYLGLDD
jgi:hypothetical protein